MYNICASPQAINRVINWSWVIFRNFSKTLEKIPKGIGKFSKTFSNIEKKLKFS